MLDIYNNTERTPDPRPVTIVTGATAGIGRAFAIEFAAHGHDLLLIARRPAPFGEMAVEIGRRYGVKVHCLALDVSDPSAPDIVLEYLQTHQLRAEVLINNAASWMSGPFAIGDRDAATGLLATNVVAPCALVRGILTDMISRRRGAILNVGSLAGELPMPDTAIYSASKAFLRSFTLALRHELAGSGVTVSLLAPGLVATGLTQRHDQDTKPAIAYSLLACSPEVVARCGYRGLMSGHAVVIPGLLARIAYFGIRCVPHSLIVKLRSATTACLPRPGRLHVVSKCSSQHYLRHRKRLTLALLLCMMAMISGKVSHEKITQPILSIDHDSVAIAADMLAHDRADTTDGENIGVNLPRERSGTMNTGPGYGLVLYALARIDPRVSAAIECDANKTQCSAGASFSTVVIVQLLFAMAGLLLVFATALRLSRSWDVAILTLILVFVASRIGDFTGIIRLAAWQPALTYLSMYFALECYMRNSPLFAACSGMAIGVGALFAPIMIVMAPVTAAILAVSDRSERTGSRRLACGAAVLIGAMVGGLLLKFAQAHSYDPMALGRMVTGQLSERTAFQLMGFEAWIASLLAPVPLIGGSTEFLFTEQITRLFGPYLPGSLTMHGQTEIFPKSLAISHDARVQYAWVANTFVFGDFAKYAAVTPSILNRGIWAGAGVVGLVGMFHLKSMVAFHRVDGRIAALGVVFAPVIALLIAHTLASANHFFYNPALTFLYAYAIASVAGRI